MKCGLGACAAKLNNLENGLGSSDFYLTCRLGVVRSTPKKLRYLLHQYYGTELMNLQIETAVAKVNCLLQYYDTDTSLDGTLTAAMEHLSLEIGVAG